VARLRRNKRVAPLQEYMWIDDAWRVFYGRRNDAAVCAIAHEPVQAALAILA
jgi:hypothetical protein